MCLWRCAGDRVAASNEMQLLREVLRGGEDKGKKRFYSVVGKFPEKGSDKKC